MAGSHSLRTNEIYMTMFEINEDYSLEHEFSRKFTELKGAVDIMRVGVQPDEDIHDIIVYYRVPEESNRGQVLITNMKDSEGVTTYYFQPDQVEISGVQQEQYLMEFRQDEDYLLFAGKANYFRGTGDQLSIIVDWTQKDAYFGFFMVWTSEDHCLTPDDRIVMDYGPNFPTNYPAIEKVNYLRLKEARIPKTTMDELLETVDMDDEDYEDILADKIRESDDDEGFIVEYQDWSVPFGSSEIGTSMIIEIDGKDWLKKYTSSNNADFTAISRTGNVGLTMYGVLALVNIVLCILVWFYFLGAEYACGDNNESFCLYSDDLWWFTWLSAFIVHLGLWAPVAVMWPIVYIGSLTPLSFLRAFCYITLAGPFGLYPGVIIAMVFAFLVNPDTSGHDTRGWSSTSGIIWFSVYGGLAFLNGFISIWFIPSINAWYEEVRLAEAAEEDNLDELGFFDDNVEDQGPIIFSSEATDWDQFWEY